MKTLHRLLRRYMRATEERMIARLLRQRDAERREIDKYRQALGMGLGEFLETSNG